MSDPAVILEASTDPQKAGTMLAAAGVKLALVECGTGGVVALALRRACKGAEVLTRVHIVEGPAMLPEVVGLSPAKLSAYGWFSEMVASEAAIAMADTYFGGWGLAVLGDIAAQTLVALSTPGATKVQTYEHEAGVPLDRWVLALLQRVCLSQPVPVHPSTGG